MNNNRQSQQTSCCVMYGFNVTCYDSTRKCHQRIRH